MPGLGPGHRGFRFDALGGDYTVVFNAVEVARFSEAEPWPTDGPTIFFLGRHEERKGLEVLLDAMRRLPADVQLWIAGDGLARGYLDRPELTARYAEAVESIS